MIGYACSSIDEGDHDGLPDDFEYVIGTDPFSADSDGDGTPDATEFPLAGIAVSDPCIGGTLGATNCGAYRIFENGFESWGYVTGDGSGVPARRNARVLQSAHARHDIGMDQSSRPSSDSSNRRPWISASISTCSSLT